MKQSKARGRVWRAGENFPGPFHFPGSSGGVVISQTEGVGVGGGAGAFEAGVGVIAVFGVVKDGEGVLTVEGEGRFEMPPFSVIDLDCELLGTAVVAAVGGAVLFF